MQTETLWIDAAGKRVNHEQIRHQRAKDGSLHPGGLMPEHLNDLGYQEITISAKPDDFSDKLYFRTEQDDAPYVVYTRKPQEMIDAANAAEVEAKKNAVREVRERIVNRLMGIAGRKERGNKHGVAVACDAAVEALLAITDNLPTDPALVDGVVMQRYATIRAALEAAAPEAANVFNGMNL